MQQQPTMDNTIVFEQLWGITNEIRQKIDAHFELHPDPTTQDLQEFSSPDSLVNGSLSTLCGREIDWLVHSRLKKSTFGTMRLTTWLSSHIQVPHLAFEFGTIPNIFFYMDYIPRTNLLMDLDYLERYYQPVNPTFLRLQADTRLSLFTSKSTYIRLFQSPISLCYTCSATEEMLELVRTTAQEMLDRWLIWVDEAEPLPEEARKILAEQDLFLRRSSSERDPGNAMAAQMFGTELTNKLIRALWGGDRTITSQS
ncbi:MAG TPA: red chlorophyll catabolite reductase [Cyanophyceae cyanobacterium]